MERKGKVDWIRFRFNTTSFVVFLDFLAFVLLSPLTPLIRPIVSFPLTLAYWLLPTLISSHTITDHGHTTKRIK